MALSTLLLAVWLILVGLVWLTWAHFSTQFLGGWAVVTGLVFLIEQARPIVIPVRRTPQA